MFFSNFLEKRKKAKEQKLIQFCKEVIRTGTLRKSYYGGILFIENENYRPRVHIDVTSFDEETFNFEYKKCDFINSSMRYELTDSRNNHVRSVVREHVTFSIKKGDPLFTRLLQEKKESEEVHLAKMIDAKTEEILSLKNKLGQIDEDISKETQVFNEKKSILKDVIYSHTVPLKEHEKINALEKQKNNILFQIRQAERALQQPESIVMH